MVGAALARRCVAVVAAAVLAIAGLVGSVILSAAPAGAAAQTFVVDTLLDPTPDGCGTGTCSLREAITAANATGDADTITFSVSGTITLDGGLGALPDATDDPLTVIGNGTAATIVDGATNGIPVGFGGAAFVLRNLTVSARGDSVDVYGVRADPGDITASDLVVTVTGESDGFSTRAVYAETGDVDLTRVDLTATGTWIVRVVRGPAGVTITDSTLSATADRTSSSPADAQACECAGPPVSITRSTLTATADNAGTGDANAQGCTCGGGFAGAITVTDSTFTATATTTGTTSDAFAYGCNCFDVDATNSSFTGDSTGAGDALAYGCSCDDVEGSQLHFDATSDATGDGTTTAYGCSCSDVGAGSPVTDSTMTATGTSVAGSVFVYACPCGDVDLERVTLSATATASADQYATAVGCSCGDVTFTDGSIEGVATGGQSTEADGCACTSAALVRSTVVATADGPGAFAIGVQGATGSAVNVTFSVTATGTDAFAWAWSAEAAVEIREVTAVVDGPISLVFATLDDTTIANSILVGECGTSTSVSEGGNVALTGSGCGSWMTEPNDRLVADAGILPLADNGGPGPTFLITRASAAFDNGLAASCSATDERGVPRPQFAACDSGAVEIAPEPVPAVPLEPTFTG